MAYTEYTNDPIVVAIKKPTTEEVTESTTLQDDNDFSLLVRAGEEWVIDYHLISTFDTDAQIKIGFTVPTGSTLLGIATMNADAVTPSTKTTNTSGEGMDMTIATATLGRISAKAIVTVAADGFITLQWAQGVSDVAATTVQAGSTMIATKL